MKKILAVMMCLSICSMLFGCAFVQKLQQYIPTLPDMMGFREQVQKHEEADEQEDVQEQEETQEHVHAYGNWSITIAPTCNSRGQLSRCCECGETEQKSLAKESHKYVDDGRVEPQSSTPTSKLQRIYRCTMCGDSYTENIEITGNKGLQCAFAYSEEYGVYCLITGVDVYELSIARGSSTAFTIPSAICGYPVKVIQDGALDDSLGLTSIVVPEGVVHIGENAFRSQYKLESITIPASVEYIGKNAFAECYVLKQIQFNGTLEQFYKNVRMWNALNISTNMKFVCKDGMGYPFA